MRNLRSTHDVAITKKVCWPDGLMDCAVCWTVLECSVLCSFKKFFQKDENVLCSFMEFFQKDGNVQI